MHEETLNQIRKYNKNIILLYLLDALLPFDDLNTLYALHHLYALYRLDALHLIYALNLINALHLIDALHPVECFLKDYFLTLFEML